MPGFGFVGMARQAREGRGSISLRHALAGPSTKQRRSASGGGGRAGDALAAAQILRRLRGCVGESAWRMLWALCVDGDTQVAVMKRFAITQGVIKARVAEALEKLAVAYES
jgi:hypothetical protein